MRDVLYLSETKLGTLAGQLRGRMRRRLGLEAGVHAGIVSFKATLAPMGQAAALEVLDAVVRMIERERGLKRHTDHDLRPGHWVRFEEDFHYGTAHRHGRREASGLVYFPSVSTEPCFLLVGSAVHVTDRRYTPDETTLGPPTPYYAEAVNLIAQSISCSRDDGALDDIDHYSPDAVPARLRPEGTPGTLGYGISWMCGAHQQRMDPGFVGPVLLSGMARVLAVESSPDGSPRAVLATPLYLEYAVHA